MNTRRPKASNSWSRSIRLPSASTSIGSAGSATRSGTTSASLTDPCHFGVGSPDSYLAAIGKPGSRIKCVHFSDSDKISSELHFPPGKGCLDLDGILNELKGIDFRGSWMVDYWLYPLPEEAARSGLAFLREALKDFDHYSA